MLQNWLAIANLLSGSVLVVSYVVVLIVINALAKGRARTFGLFGVLALLLSTGLSALNGAVGPWVAATYNTRAAYGVGSVVVAGVGAVGVVLLALGVVAARRAAQAQGGGR